MQAGFVTTSSQSTQVGLYEYALVAYPDSSVNAKILVEKQNFYDQYGAKSNIKSQPNICIANFVAHEAMEETMVRYMQRLFMGHQSFEVALNNYSGFPPDTVYLRVQDPQPFRQVGKNLNCISSYISSCSCPPVKLVSNPHISIEQQLPERIYSKAIMDYSKKIFHDSFTVNELVLIRRRSEYDQGKAINVFHLQPAKGKNLTNHLFN
jgi:hypothetical protein